METEEQRQCELRKALGRHNTWCGWCAKKKPQPDVRGFVTARAVVIAFRPPTYPLAYDIADDAGGGRFVVLDNDLSKVRANDCVTVRFHPQDRFAQLVSGGGALPWEGK